MFIASIRYQLGIFNTSSCL